MRENTTWTVPGIFSKIRCIASVSKHKTIEIPVCSLLQKSKQWETRASESTENMQTEGDRKWKGHWRNQVGNLRIPVTEQKWKLNTQNIWDKMKTVSYKKENSRLATVNMI